MSYDYHRERPELFTESGVKMLLQIRATADELLKISGAFQAQRAWRDCTGSNWTMMAALDYLVETKHLRRATEKGTTWGQHEVFIAGSDL